MLAMLVAAAVFSGDGWAGLRSKLDGFEDQNFTGGVYVSHKGEEKFFHGVGEVNPASGKTFTADTPVEIGSIVKSFVKAAICQLAADGKLSLDDSIAKHFENVPADKRPITIQMLIDHTSGFKDMFGDDYSPMGRDELMRLMLASKLIFSPGEKEEYSNSGYSMLSTIIEKVTGETVEAHINRTQFRPIGLKRTGYVLPRWTSRDLPAGTTMTGKSWGTPLDKYWAKDGPSWNLRGNGGMFSTFRELAKWSHSAHTGDFLTNEAYALYEPELAADPNLGAVIGEAGGNGIFNCTMFTFPREQLIVIGFSTDARFSIEDHMREIFGLAREAVKQAK